MDETISKPGSAFWLKAAAALGITAMAAFAWYGWKTGIFSSREAMERFLSPFGIWAPIVFVLLQVVQVIIPILPGGVSTLAGVLLFGPIWGFVYNYVGICAGSTLAFLLARRYGRPLVQKLTDKKAYDKYSKWLEGGKKFDWCFAAAIFFPMAPDDLLCFLAGVTNMSLRRFIAIILLAKPVSIALYSMGLYAAARAVL